MASAWLMKAEPESRIVNGKDVAFSANIFEGRGTEHWDGVRNHQAKNFMKQAMKVGDPVLFYHSNCKTPGVAALAEVAKEGYPDFTAFDPTHPYYDAKSSKDTPTWYMVDVRFKSHLAHFVSLSLLQSIAQTSHADLPESVRTYLTPASLDAIKNMPLLQRGRLSVQPVSPEAYAAIALLGERGGFEGLDVKAKAKKPANVANATAAGKKRKGKVSKAKEDLEEDEGEVSDVEDEAPPPKKVRKMPAAQVKQVAAVDAPRANGRSRRSKAS